MQTAVRISRALVLLIAFALSACETTPPRPEQKPAPAEPKPFPRTPLTTLTEAIDWALAENARQGSPYFGRIDPKAIAVAGFSCGGLQAALTAKDPRVATLIMQNTGTYDKDAGMRP